jgi:signal transduction histidine kinase
MGQNLTKLCYEECLRHINDLPHSKHPRILLHTLKANVHALGMTQLALEIHHAENNKTPAANLPLKKWLNEIKKLDIGFKDWADTLGTIASEANKTLELHWHGPKIEELSSIIVHLARNTIAHGNKSHLNIWVTVKQRQNKWHVQVKDDGGGFTKAQRPLDVLAGQGAGLEYVRLTLKGWGGTCGILSNPNVGLIVTLEFPIICEQVLKTAA